MKALAEDCVSRADYVSKSVASVASAGWSHQRNMVAAYHALDTASFKSKTYISPVAATRMRLEPARVRTSGYEVTFQSTIPKGFLTPTLRLERALDVRVWPEGKEWVAAADEIGLHAFGTDPSSAISNLKREIAEYYLWLEGAGDRISPRLRREREQFRALVST